MKKVLLLLISFFLVVTVATTSITAETGLPVAGVYEISLNDGSLKEIGNTKVGDDYYNAAISTTNTALSGILQNGYPIISFDISDTYLQILSYSNDYLLLPDCGYVFQADPADPNETKNDYDNWYADFTVSFDKNIAKDSLGLVGYYPSWGALGFFSPIEVQKDVKIPLLNTILSNTGMSDWTYSQIKESVNTFICGAFNLSNENIGTTMTVELRIFDPTMEPSDIINGNNWEEGVNTYCLEKVDYTFTKAGFVPKVEGKHENLYFAGTANTNNKMPKGYYYLSQKRTLENDEDVNCATAYYTERPEAKIGNEYFGRLDFALENYSDNDEIAILENSTITGAASKSGDSIVTLEKVSVDFGGKEVNVSEGVTLNIKDGMYKGISKLVKDKGTISITGGLFDEKPNVAYVDAMYKIVDNLDNETKATYPYTITQKEYVAKIGETKYTSINDAIKAIPNNNETLVTIELLKDINQDELVSVNKNNVTINGNGYKVVADTNKVDWAKYKVGGASQGYGKANLFSVSGKNVTLKDMTISVADFRGLSCATTRGGENVTYYNVKYEGRGCGHYYGYGKETVLFKKCEFLTQGYAIHCSNEGDYYEMVIDNCKVHGWNSFGGAKKITAIDTEFYGADDSDNGVKKNGLLAKFRPYVNATLTNCKFSTDYLSTDSPYCGFDSGKKVFVTFNNCSLINPDGTKNNTHSVYEIIDYRDSDVTSNNGDNQNSVFAFDAKGDNDIGYFEGTFVTKDEANVKVSKGCKVTQKDTLDTDYKVLKVEKITEAGESKVVVSDTDYDIPTFFENVTDLKDAVDIVKTVNEEKNNNGEKISASTIVVENTSGINAEIDDSVIIVAKTNGSNEVKADPGYKLNTPINDTSAGTTTYTATALEIGKSADGGDGSGKKDGQQVDTITTINEENQVSTKVLDSAGTVNDTNANKQLGEIVVENIDALLKKVNVNQGSASAALNKAGIATVTTDGGAGEVAAKDVNVYVLTQYATEVIDDKTTEVNKSYKLDITPVYQAYASTAPTKEEMIIEGDGANSVKVGSVEKVNCSNKKITLRMQLPAGFVLSESEKVYVVHTLENGTKKTYETTLEKIGDNFFIEFVNEDGFSVFEITKVYIDYNSDSPSNNADTRRVIPNTFVK